MPGFRQSLRVVPDESFGSMLRAHRFEDGLSQAELGARFGVRQQTVGAWERGERPQARFLPALADYVGLRDEQELRRLLETEERMHAHAPVGSATQVLDPNTARAVEALATLTESFAERIRQGEPLSAEDRAVLQDAVLVLGRLTSR